MKLAVRYILFWPFSLLYGLITWFRNLLFNRGVLNSYTPNIPTIVVGNLAVGGTGKTPHIEMLLRFFEPKYKTAVLSRGYKRKTKGFILADAQSTSSTIGDEPFQMFRKFKNTLFAVDEKRVNGVLELLKREANIQLVLFDDAFQHRAINPGFKILLTDYSNLYCSDSMLPGGNLREYSSGARRADMVIVTKCPPELTVPESKSITRKLKLQHSQRIFFTSIVYDNIKPVFEGIDECNGQMCLQGMLILLVTGIVSPGPLVRMLELKGAIVKSMPFSDHHHFSASDYYQVQMNFLSLQGDRKLILVTEKDASRIVCDDNYPTGLKSVTYFIPILIEILHNKQEIFQTQLQNYVDTYKSKC